MSAAEVDRQPTVTWLRYALVQMVIRYGSSQQKTVYAANRGRTEAEKRHKRAAHRQFAAVQRIANALEDLARDVTR